MDRIHIEILNSFIKQVSYIAVTLTLNSAQNKLFPMGLVLIPRQANPISSSCVPKMSLVKSNDIAGHHSKTWKHTVVAPLH